MKKLVFIFLAICACSNDKIPQNNMAMAQSENFISFVANAELPHHLSFCGEKVPLNDPEVRERAEREFYLLLQQPGQLVLYIKRSAKYFPIFEKIIKAKGLPEDLKYLSVAESALMMSRSPKDAIGLWQFMEATGKKMGLRIDEYVDERRDVGKSTSAALEYLKQGYNSTNSWTLSAAGYNMGHTGLANALEFQIKKNFYDLYLNEETSRYILRIVLIREIMENPHKYGIKLSKNEMYTIGKTKTIKVQTAIPDIAKWAASKSCSYKDVKILNPWILKQSLNEPKGGSYEILIPSN